MSVHTDISKLAVIAAQRYPLTSYNIVVVIAFVFNY